VQQELTNNNWIRTLRGKITTAHPSGSVFRMPIYSWMKKIKLLGNGLRMDNKHTKYNSWAPTDDTEQATFGERRQKINAQFSHGSSSKTKSSRPTTLLNVDRPIKMLVLYAMAH